MVQTGTDAAFEKKKDKKNSKCIFLTNNIIYGGEVAVK